MGTQGLSDSLAIGRGSADRSPVARTALVFAALAATHALAACSSSFSSSPPAASQAAITVPPPPTEAAAVGAQPAYAPPGQQAYAPPGQPAYAPPGQPVSAPPSQQAYAPPPGPAVAAAPVPPPEQANSAASLRASYVSFLEMFRDPPETADGALPLPRQTLFQGAPDSQQAPIMPHPPSTYVPAGQPYSPPPGQAYAPPPGQPAYGPPAGAQAAAPAAR
jgi:hypothetical protein